MEKSNTSMKLSKLFFILLSIAVIPFGISSYLYYQTSIEQLSSKVEEELRVRAEGLSTQIDAWTEINIRMLTQNAAFEDVFSMNSKKQLPVLKSIVKEYKDWMHLAQAIGIDGNTTARSDNKQIYLGDRNWFQEAMKGSYGLNVQVGRTTGAPSCAIGVPIFNQDKKVVGVLALASKTSVISAAVNPDKIGNTGFAFVLNNEGRLLAHYNKKLTEGYADYQKHPILQELGKAPNKKVIFVDDTTKKKTVAYLQRGKYEWIAVAQQDYDELYAPVTSLHTKLLVLFSIVLTVTVVIAWLIARYLTRLGEKSEKLRLGIFPRLMVSMLVLAIVPIVIVSIISHRLSTQFLADRTLKILNVQSDNLAAHIDIWGDMYLKLARHNVSLEAMKSMNPKTQRPLLQSISKAYPSLWAHTAAVPSGQNIARSDEETFQNVADREWFQQAANGVAFSSDVVISKTRKKPVWAFAVPIYNDSQKVVGVLRLSSYIAELSDTITQTKIGKTGFAYLMTDKGKLVAHQQKAFTQTLLDFNKLPTFTQLSGKTKEQITFINESSQKEIIAYSQKTKHGWIVVVQQDKQESDTSLTEIQHKIGLVLLFALVAGILGAVITVRYLK